MLGDTGTLTLDTEGKNVEHDIVIDYAKPAANYTRMLTVNGNDNLDWHLRIPTLEPFIGGGYIATWEALRADITVLTGDAETVIAIIESTAGAEGSKTHPYNVTGSCVISYQNTTGKLILNTAADTFEITIVATNE